MLLNGNIVYSGTMAATSSLGISLHPPVYATNAQLMIYSSYDPSFPTNSRNVQVVEVVFSERAQPNTFGDWELQTMTDAQLNNPAIGPAMADPDGDGAPNVLEFAMGGNPLTADRTNFMMQGSFLAGNQIAIQFHERNQLGNVVRQFESSTDLVNWTNAIPPTVHTVQNPGTISLLQAVFPAPPGPIFYRLKYALAD